jgi:hypothetical protein
MKGCAGEEAEIRWREALEIRTIFKGAELMRKKGEQEMNSGSKPSLGGFA